MDFNVSKNTYPCQSFQVSINFETLSIQQILTQNIERSTIAFLPNSHVANIPLYRLKNTSKIIYRCAIALSLQKNNNCFIAPLYLASKGVLSIEIARDIVNCLYDLSTTSQPTLDFSVRVVDPGWIDFHLSDRSLALWLQQLFQQTFLPVSFPPPPSSPSLNVFPIQYAHARCCSLLRLAEREGSIDLTDSNLFDLSKLLLLLHPAERNLISQLLELADAKASTQSQNWFKLAERSSFVLLELHRQCPIWERSKPHFPELARARLGLIKITQYFLNWLLLEKIGVTAPEQL